MQFDCTAICTFKCLLAVPFEASAGFVGVKDRRVVAVGDKQVDVF
jgi:hypothetical protein